MSIVNQIPTVILWLIRAGAGFRLTYCLFRMIAADDDMPMHKKRAKNVLIFYCIAESAFQLKDVIVALFS